VNPAFPALRPAAAAGPIGRRRVVVRWHRVLSTAARFPVSFRSGLDGAPFRLLASFALLYVIMPQLTGSAETNLKYLLVGGLTSGFYVLAVAHQRLILAPRFLLAPLLLSILGSIAFAYSIFATQDLSTFSSALIPLIGIATPMLITTHATATDGVVATKYVLALFSIAGVCHVSWQMVAHLLGWSEGNVYYDWFAVPHASASILLVYLMILAGLYRRRLLLALSVALVGLSLALRPSSTLASSALVAALIIMAHRLQLRRLLRRAGLIGTCAILAANLAVLESGDLAQTFYSIEPLVKQETLDAFSNNQTRLALISAARHDLAQHSWLIGKAFTGKVTVDTAEYLPWMPVAEMPVHSDFIIMVMEGGLVGYAVFASLFIGIALLCARGARLSREAGDLDAETLFDALQAITLIFMLCISGNPTMGSPQDTVPYLVLVALAIFLAREQPGFAGPRRRLPSGAPSVIRA
jgi:hypothetical protein